MFQEDEEYNPNSYLMDEFESPEEEEFYNEENTPNVGAIPEEDEYVFELEDEDINSINFSEVEGGDFKSSLKKLNGKLNRPAKIKVKKIPVRGHGKKKILRPRTIPIHKSSVIKGRTQRITERISVPRDRKVIIEGVDDFVFSKKPQDKTYKEIGYYKGEKLKELILIFNNDSSSDFTIELFNPSAPLDYMWATSNNLNNRISVAGNAGASYSDVIYYMLANPTIIPNCRVIMSGASITSQTAQGMMIKNKNLEGKMRIDPLNVNLAVDAFQYQSGAVNFDLMGNLNRPFIPDGMDVMQYTVLAGMTVTLCFYYKQHSLKKFFFPEAKANKKLM